MRSLRKKNSRATIKSKTLGKTKQKVIVDTLIDMGIEDLLGLNDGPSPLS